MRSYPLNFGQVPNNQTSAEVPDCHINCFSVDVFTNTSFDIAYSRVLTTLPIFVWFRFSELTEPIYLAALFSRLRFLVGCAQEVRGHIFLSLDDSP
jgi:hypothetical protein